MSGRRFVFSILLFQLFFGAPALLAQLPQCPEVPWGSAQVYDLDLVNGCPVRVSYNTRLSCNSWQDLQILEIEPLQPAAASCVSYQSMHPKVVVDEVTEEMIRLNPMNFSSEPQVGTPPPEYDYVLPWGCHLEWRVFVGSCWSLFPFQQPVWKPCYTSTTCYRRFMICTDPPRKTPVGGTSAGPCQAQYPPAPTSCYPVCGWQ